MKTVTRIFLRIFFTVAMVHGTRTAHAGAADGAAAEIYSDAKDLAIDLIQSEVAKSGASLMACRAPSFMLYYFPSTLQTMRKPPLNVEALGKSARADAAELAGDWVRQSVLSGHMTNLAGLNATAQGKLSNPDGLADIAAKCSSEPDEASSENLQGILRKFLEYRQSKVANPLSDCSAPYQDTEGNFDQRNASACELGLAVRAAVVGDIKATQSYLVGALMVPATVRVAGKYQDWSKMKDEALSLLNASGENYPNVLANSFSSGAAVAIQAQLRDLAAHVRTTILANGSPVALQQLLVSALHESKVFLNSTEAQTVDRVLAIVSDQQFLLLLEAVKSGDGHRIVIEAIDTGSLAIASAQAADIDDKRRAAIGASLAVLKYATEVHANQTAAESTREAAKEALFTYMSEYGKGGYTSSKGLLGWHWGFEPLTLSLGASFSTGYVNSDVQGLRTLVTAEGLVAKVGFSQKRWSYLGLHISALNLLGYPSEVVLRDPQKSFGNEDLSHFVGLTLHPRADFVFGVPAFSRKLALFVGVGFTTVAPIRRADGSYAYAWIGDRPKDASGEYGPRFLDFSAGIRFFPF